MPEPNLSESTIREFCIGITHLVIDNRQVMPGGLFFAYPGLVHDGRDFIPQAISQGASAIVYEAIPEGSDRFPQSDWEKAASQSGVRFLAVHNLREQVGHWAHVYYGKPSNRLRIIGVTGTNGKSSVVHLIRSCLEGLGVAAASLGTLGVWFKNRQIHLGHTTPDPIVLHHTLAQLVEEGCQWVAMEVSSHALDQGRVAGVAFETAVLTQITHDHLDYHGSFSNYVAAKKKLFAIDTLQHLIFNQADPHGREWSARPPHPSAQITAYCRTDKALPGGADNPTSGIFAHMLSMGLSGMEVQWGYPGHVQQLTLRLVGAVQLENALAAFSALYAMGHTPEDLLRCMTSLTPPCGRMECFGGGVFPYIIVDYAHTPDALDRLLGALRVLVKGRLAVVFGCGGLRDTAKRPIMGKIAAEWADQVWLTDDNPRTENPQQIVQAILSGIDPKKRGKVHIEHDRSLAILSAIAQLGPHDALVVAGKGHECTQWLDASARDYSDQSVIASYLATQPQKDT